MAGTVSPVLLLVTVSYLLCVAGAVLSEQVLSLCPEPLQLGESYTIPVNISSPQSLCYILDSETQCQALRWHGSADGALIQHPVLVTVRQPRGVSSLSLPFLENGFAHHEVQRILCPLLNVDNECSSGQSLLLIDLTTSSPVSINFKLEIQTIESFELQLNKPQTLLSSPSSPSFMVFEFPEDLNHVSVKVSASEETRNICAIASIQNVYCPSVELLDSVQGRGKFQSMRSIARFHVKKNPRKFNFIYVVLAVFPTDSPNGDCDVINYFNLDTEMVYNKNQAPYEYNPTFFKSGTRVKNVTITVEPGLSRVTYIFAGSLLVIFLVTVYSVAFMWITVFEWWQYTKSTVDQVDEECGSLEEIFTPEPLPSLEEDPVEEASVEEDPYTQQGPPSPVRAQPDPTGHESPTKLLNISTRRQNSMAADRRASLKLPTGKRRPSPLPPLEENGVESSKPPTLVSVLTGSHWNKEKKKVVLKRQRTMSLMTPTSASSSPSTPSAGALRWLSLRHRKNSIIRLGAVQNNNNSVPDDSVTSDEPQFKYDKLPFPVNVHLSEVGEIDETQSAYDYYPHYIFVICAFYSFPVFELLNGYLWFLGQGNEDICYHNFLCANPVTMFGVDFASFNNVFTNINYLFLGILMILVTSRRRSLYRLYNEINVGRPVDKKVGIPHQFGIYYGIGMAMIGQAVLSSAYHMCPTKDNFKFDASFIYVQSGLAIHKFLQTRIPDKSAGLHEIMLILVGLMLTVIVGMWDTESMLFWIPFIFMYLLITVIFAVEIYYRWEICSWEDLKELYQFWRTAGVFPPRHKTKFLHSTATVLLNLVIAWYGLFHPIPKFANYVMYILLGNDILHLIAYLASKIVYKELTRKTISVRIGVLSFVSIMCWIIALQYFKKDLTDWNLTPAQSRDQNLDCELLWFYDGHDIWHVTGGFAMFFTTMLVMSVDDSLEKQTRDKIFII